MECNSSVRHVSSFLVSAERTLEANSKDEKTTAPLADCLWLHWQQHFLGGKTVTQFWGPRIQLGCIKPGLCCQGFTAPKHKSTTRYSRIISPRTPTCYLSPMAVLIVVLQGRNDSHHWRGESWKQRILKCLSAFLFLLSDRKGFRINNAFMPFNIHICFSLPGLQSYK